MIRIKSNNVLDLNQIINFTQKKKKTRFKPIYICVCMYVLYDTCDFSIRYNSYDTHTHIYKYCMIYEHIQYVSMIPYLFFYSVCYISYI